MSLKKIIFVLIFAGTLCFCVYETPNVFPIKNGELTVLRKDIKTGQLHPIHVGPKTKDWTPISKVSKFFLNAIVVSEDSRFYHHWGLDFREMWNSLLMNVEEGRYARGASTITQQLVRMLFLSREKTLMRKTREIFGALVLECVLSKDEILEWYVNLIPLGPSQYGVQEASRVFFNTDPELLNISQSILLAMVVPAPGIWTPALLRKDLTEAGKKRFAKIAYALFSEAYITPVQLQKTLASGNFGSPIMFGR